MIQGRAYTQSEGYPSGLIGSRRGWAIVLEVVAFALFLGLLEACLSTNGLYSLYSFAALICILIVLVLISAYYEEGFINPLCIWEISWCGSLVVARLDTDLYPAAAHAWSPDLSVLIYLDTIIFYSAFRLFSLNRGKHHSDKTSSVRHNLDSDAVYKASIFVNSVVFFSVVCYLLNALQMDGVPMLNDSLSYRIDFQSTTLFTFFNIARILSFFYPYALFCDEISSKIKKLCAFLFLLYACLAFATASRGIFFQWIIAFLTGYIAVKRTSFVKQVIISIALFMALVILVGLFGFIREYMSGGSVSGSFIDYVVFSVYTYIAPNFVNLQTAVNTLHPWNSFVYSTEGLWSIFLSSSVFPGYQNLSFATGAFNVSTYLLAPYADWGLFGTAVVTFVFGALSGLSRMRSLSGSFGGGGFLAIMNIIVFSMQNTFMAQSASVTVWFFLVAFMTLIFVKPGETHQNSAMNSRASDVVLASASSSSEC